jgi:hypothetical protein
VSIVAFLLVVPDRAWSLVIPSQSDEDEEEEIGDAPLKLIVQRDEYATPLLLLVQLFGHPSRSRMEVVEALSDMTMAERQTSPLAHFPSHTQALDHVCSYRGLQERNASFVVLSDSATRVWAHADAAFLVLGETALAPVVPIIKRACAIVPGLQRLLVGCTWLVGVVAGLVLEAPHGGGGGVTTAPPRPWLALVLASICIAWANVPLWYLSELPTPLYAAGRLIGSPATWTVGFDDTASFAFSHPEPTWLVVHGTQRDGVELPLIDGGPIIDPTQALRGVGDTSHSTVRVGTRSLHYVADAWRHFYDTMARSLLRARKGEQGGSKRLAEEFASVVCSEWNRHNHTGHGFDDLLGSVRMELVRMPLSPDVAALLGGGVTERVTTRRETLLEYHCPLPAAYARHYGKLNDAGAATGLAVPVLCDTTTEVAITSFAHLVSRRMAALEEEGSTANDANIISVGPKLLCNLRWRLRVELNGADGTRRDVVGLYLDLTPELIARPSLEVSARFSISILSVSGTISQVHATPAEFTQETPLHGFELFASLSDLFTESLHLLDRGTLRVAVHLQVIESDE